MIRTYMQQNRDWFLNSDPFSRLGDMESEIAELRTLTKVTRLRKQIECKEEGAWMMVTDVPDENAPSGTRKVTSYGMSKRSVTRSISSNVDFGNIFVNEMSSEPIVQHPGEEQEQHEKPASSVEITEVLEEPLRSEIPEFNKKISPEKPANKKTSVVTLGKGNLVLIDPEDDSTFQVTGICKGKVADVINTLEKGTEKKVKKVGFCKTEVHFAPDSGKINIVETDEKPPPTQVYRKKKKTRVKSRINNSLPKHYFGELEDFGEDSNFSNESDREDSKSFVASQDAEVFSNIREKFPIFERTIKSEGKDIKYRHSSPEKSEFNIEKIKSDEKDFFKKLKQPTFRDKVLKETSYIPDKMFSDNNLNVNEITKDVDNHPKLKEKLYLYGGCNHSKERELLKSNCKLSTDDYGTISNIKGSENIGSDLYLSKEGEGSGKIDAVKAEELGHQLKYTELLKIPSTKAEKIPEKTSISNSSVRAIPVVQTNSFSDTDFSNSKKNIALEKITTDACNVARIPVDQDIKSGVSFLENVSPKLKNLIQNSVEHEFQLRQKQILQKKTFEKKLNNGDEGKVKSTISISLSANNEKEDITVIRSKSKPKPVKTVTQVHLGPNTEPKNEFQLKRDEITKTLFTEPIYTNKDLDSKDTIYLLNEEPVPAPRIKKEPLKKKEVARDPPKPKPRTITSTGVEKMKVQKTPVARVLPRTVSTHSTKKVQGRESTIRDKDSDKCLLRSSVTKDEPKSKRVHAQTKTDMGTRQRSVKVSTEMRSKKVGREPLRSFEKVSNGWVGSVRQDGLVSATRLSHSATTKSSGPHTSGTRRSTHTSSSSKTSHSHSSTRLDGTRRGSKHFSLSREHLSSAKLVKELGRGASTKKINSGDRNGKKHSTTARVAERARRESERSDDSLIQADLEVRAYMFEDSSKKEA